MSFSKVLDTAPQNLTIEDAIGKCYTLVRNHNKIKASISGGSDSDILMDMIIRCGGKDKTDFVFFNTGLEYKATKNHIEFLKKKYNVDIVVIPPVKPIPKCVKEYGVPFWSKRVSDRIMRLQKHNFQWEDEPLDVLLQKYPRCRSALRWWCNDHDSLANGKPSALNIEYVPWLKEFLISNPPTFKISPECCHYAKKLPAENYTKREEFDLDCTGVRKAEGGVRATSYSSCFTQNTAKASTYRPLFWFTDTDKKEYDEHYGIEHSDCYKVWGMKRTGCAGCPFSQDFEKELELAKKHEPNFHRAMLKIFGESYEYRRRFYEFRRMKKEKMKKKEDAANCSML
jgi:3'-phosphoadenosine 5'-phosphosulfate sulfotransferase (PAPS reductase)/FAD synthetase